MTEKLIRETQVDLTSTAARITQVETNKLSKTEAQNLYVPLTQKGVANGVAGLNANGQIADGQIPYATSSVVGGITHSFDAQTGTWTIFTEDL